MAARVRVLAYRAESSVDGDRTDTSAPRIDFRPAIMGKSSKAGKGLKSALQAQQSRLQKKQQAEKAAQVAEQRNKTQKKGGGAIKSKGKGKAPARRPTIPFRATDTILLIGEGNFSFARALVVDAPGDLAQLPASNVTATAYDSEEECYAKYPDAEAIVTDLRERGVHVLFGVDATRLTVYLSLNFIANKLAYFTKILSF